MPGQDRVNVGAGGLGWIVLLLSVRIMGHQILLAQIVFAHQIFTVVSSVKKWSVRIVADLIILV